MRGGWLLALALLAAGPAPAAGAPAAASPAAEPRTAGIRQAEAQGTDAREADSPAEAAEDRGTGATGTGATGTGATGTGATGTGESGTPGAGTDAGVPAATGTPAAAGPARAEQVISALSQNRVAITTGFDGSEIFIYGAVKRTAPVPAGGPIDVVVVLIGPSAPVIVRKKERRFGIWINDEGVQVDAAPSFYAVASNRPLPEILSHTENLRYRIGLEHAVRLIADTDAEAYPEEYRLAVKRLRRNAGLYSELPGAVTIDEDTLFRTSIALPAQLVEGDYRARVFILRDKQVIDLEEQVLAVRKVGLERWIYTMAQEQSLIYGLLSIAIALAAGWLASTFFRIFFP